MTRDRLRRQRVATALVGVAVALLTVGTAVAPAVEGAGDDTRFTGLVGADQYSNGTYLRYDYVFDDRGAATGPAVDDPENVIFPGATAARSTRGSYRYPDEHDNLADIVAVRLDTGQITIVLNALDPGSTVVGVAIDTDMDLETGTGEWPFGARLTTAGADVVLTGYDGAEGVDYDADVNTITLRLPESPPVGRWRLWAGAGLWDGQAWMEVPPGNVGNSPGTGSLGTFPKLFDLAFNVGETYEGFQDYWTERRQAEALGAGDIQAHAAIVDFGQIRERAEQHPAPPRGAFSTFVYRSSIELGDGLVAEPRRPHDNFVYLSRWQPFTVYVPTTLRTPNPLVWLMHARGMNHNSYAVIDHRFTRIGEELGAILVTPLSRGEYRMCEADAEVDFFDTWGALRNAFDLDDDRTYLTGLSMGGICMWRLGLLYPDLFAAGIAVAGSPRLGAYPSYSPLPVPYDMTDYVTNARHLPILVLHGASDAVLPYTDTDPAVQRLDELGFEHRVHLYATRGHDATLTSATAQSHIDWLKGRSRVTSPPRVTYRTWPQEVIHDDPAMLNRDYGFTYDRAYWISDIQQADPAAPSSVDARVAGAAPPETEAVEGTADEDAGPFMYFGRQPTQGQSQETPQDNALEIETDNVASATIDLAKASVRTDTEITVTVTGDATLILNGAWEDTPQVRPRPANVTANAVTLTAPGTYTISPRVSTGINEPAPTSPLPATGSDTSLLSLTLLGTALLARARRNATTEGPPEARAARQDSPRIPSDCRR